MKKILVGYFTDKIASGINKYLLMFIDNIISDEAEIDCLTKECSEETEEILKKHGCKNVYRISRNRHFIRQYKECLEIMKNGYDIAYFNISESFDCVGVLAAKHSPVGKIAVHSHSSDTEKGGILISLCRALNFFCKPIVSNGTKKYTCSDFAAKWLFTSKVFKSGDYATVYNAVDTSRFFFDENKRKEMRKKLGFENALVLGNCARFCDSKNQMFLLDVLKILKEKGENAKLILIGDGTDYLEKVRLKAKKDGLFDDVIFTGAIKNVDNYMQSFDVFLLPSKKEGLAFVGNEAQFCLVPCVFSNAITRQSEISSLISYIGIKNPSLWADEILKYRGMRNTLTPESEKFISSNCSKQFKEIIQ